MRRAVSDLIAVPGGLHRPVWSLAVCLFGLLNSQALLWSQATAKGTAEFSSPVISLAASADGKLVFAGSANILTVLDSDLQKQQTLRSELDFVNDLCVVDQFLLAAGGSPAEHGLLEIYRLPSMKLVKRKLLHDDVIQSIENDQTHLFTASADGTIKKLKWDTLEEVMTFRQHSKRPLVVRSIPNTRLIASAGLDDTVRVWNSETGKTLRVLTHHQNDVLDISIKPSTQSLPLMSTVSRDKTMRIWQPTIGRMVRFKKFDEVPTVCHWVADTDWILVGTDAGNVWLVNSQNLQTRRVAACRTKIFAIDLMGSALTLSGTKRKLIASPFAVGRLKTEE